MQGSHARVWAARQRCNTDAFHHVRPGYGHVQDLDDAPATLRWSDWVKGGWRDGTHCVWATWREGIARWTDRLFSILMYEDRPTFDRVFDIHCQFVRVYRSRYSCAQRRRLMEDVPELGWDTSTRSPRLHLAQQTPSPGRADMVRSDGPSCMPLLLRLGFSKGLLHSIKLQPHRRLSGTGLSNDNYTIIHAVIAYHLN